MKKIGYLIITIILLSTTLILQSCSEGTKSYQLGSDPVNASSFGFVMVDGDSLYHLNGGSNDCIVKNNGDKTESYEGTYAKGLNIYKDYLYYSGFDDTGNQGIYRMKLDGSGHKEQISEWHSSSIIVVDDYIYALCVGSKGFGIYRLSLDGKSTKCLVEGSIAHMQWYEGYIYYSLHDDKQIYKIKPNGRGNTIIKTEDYNFSVDHFIVADGWIYLEHLKFEKYKTNHPKIFRVKIDGSEYEYLADGNLRGYYKDGPYILYTKTESGPTKLYRLDIDGSSEELILEDNILIFDINIIDDKIYILDWDLEDFTSDLYETDITGENYRRITS